VHDLKRQKLNLNAIFGWSTYAWYVPFRRVIKALPKSRIRILELGSGPYSQLALYFDHPSNVLEITTFPAENFNNLKAEIEEKKQKFSLRSEINTKCLSAFECTEKYDLIILKSVLGGLFRTNETSLQDVKHFVNQLVDNNLNDDGALVTLDNGYSAFEPLLRNFGARKKNWRRFRKSDFSLYVEQTSFGFFSCFSFATRIGKVGHAIDTILFGLDFILDCMWMRWRPAIIVTVYRR